MATLWNAGTVPQEQVEQAASVARLADGVVVGSALFDRIAKAASKEQAEGDVLGLCRELAEGVRGARP